ncbi:MAG TPA: Txe/YoeB family addiction module toxin [Saprospiraceae bacterium]|nr:Txe/YoeB family addiction module toxin [Saprospiraceae bacterium]
MKIEFTELGWEDFNFWLLNDKEITNKILELIKSILRTPFEGIGKPEPLKNEFKGCWSRRINREHRLVYIVEGIKGENQKCTILQCRYHYGK